ncbi:MAG: winged helix-turn-helix domain-containing protein [Mycobacteriales bacterium]
MVAAAQLSLRDARRLALAAGGLARGRGRFVRPGQLLRVAHQLSAIQLDSVNVLVRAHYLPAFSRLGCYPRSALDGLASGTGSRRALFEYWGHAASLLPVELYPLLRWRMRRAEERFETWGGPARLARERPGYIQEVLAQIADRGPLAAAELTDRGHRPTGEWGWNWHEGKVALEWLFWTGQVTTFARRGFVRVYDLTERVLPAAILNSPDLGEAESQRQLLLLAARALGVATVADLADYFRIPLPVATARARELQDAGELTKVSVVGWAAPGYLLAGTRIPGPARARALLSPFDPLVWFRDRVRRLFGFDYRIEIYYPAGKRVHGYYVLPFLLGDELSARVDLKADRAPGRLLVQAAWGEVCASDAVPLALASEIVDLAGWLSLGEVLVAGRGDLAPALASALSELQR